MSCWAIEPQKNSLSLNDRPAEVDADFGDLLVVIGRFAGHPAREQLVRHVRRLELLTRVVAARRATELIGAALDDEVEPDAAGGLLDVVAAGRDLDFVERVVVEVGRRGAGGGHVGDRHAVHRPHGVALT